MEKERLVRIPLANMFGRKLSSSITRSIFWRVSGLTYPLLLTTLDTVDFETFASLAMSMMFAIVHLHYFVGTFPLCNIR
jgi:hypothetical protein